VAQGHVALRRALAIQGAQSVRVVSLATGATVWSQTVEDRPDADDADPDLSGAVAALADLAARIVGLTDADPLFDDLVLSSFTRFHVLRLTMTGVEPHVVHLVLKRGVANLALARLELKSLAAAPAAERPGTRALPAGPSKEILEAVPEPALPDDAEPPTELPHRTGAPAVEMVVTDGDTVGEHADDITAETPAGWGSSPAFKAWLADFSGQQPFETDTDTLNRVLAGLRGL
jgi:hypothetical protein